MNMELSDAKDDLPFDKQTLLFSLVLSDLLIVNMSLQEVNRDTVGNIQLLRALLEERVTSKLDFERTKILVVIHGQDDKVPLAKLQEDVLTKLQKLWASIHLPSLILSEYFEVSVIGLPDNKLKPQDFEEKVSIMRRWFGGKDITGFKKDRILAQGFSLGAKGVWDAVRQKKQLGVFLFSHKITLSDTICSNMANEILTSPEFNKDLLSLKKGDHGASKEFSKKLGSLLEVTLTRYDAETQVYDADMRQKKRGKLEKSICALVESTFKEILVESHIKVFQESKQVISNQLSTAEDPTSGIDDAVKGCINKFVESCEDLSSRYPDLFNQYRSILETELNAIAEIIASNIEEKRKREEAELKALDAKTEIERHKSEAANARSESQRIQEESEQIAKQSVEEIHRISRLAKEDTERVKKELEIVKEEQRKQAAEAEARGPAGQRWLGVIRAVAVVARVVVLKDPTVIVDIVDFALWHGRRSGVESFGSDSGSHNGKEV